jgi:hypothetical protein
MTAPKKPLDLWWARLWRAEPVLVSTVVPVAATAGLLTAGQASTVTTVLLVAAQVAAAFGIRTQVKPKGKA